MSDVVSVSFHPVSTEKGHPKIKFDISRGGTFAQLKEAFVLEPPYFQADTLKFCTVKKPIGSDDELTSHLGVENSVIIFYSTGKTIVFGLRTFLALSYLALFDNIRAKSIFGLEICGSNRR